jgi:hypothetical protein
MERIDSKTLKQWVEEVIPEPLTDLRPDTPRTKRAIHHQIGFAACSLLKYYSKIPLIGDSLLSDYIIKNIPDNWKGEFIHTLVKYGVKGLLMLSRRLCGVSSDLNLSNQLAIYEKLYPNHEVPFEKFLAFTEWAKVSINTGLEASEESTEDLREKVYKMVAKYSVESTSTGEMLLMFDVKDIGQDLIQSVRNEGEKLVPSPHRMSELIGLKYVRDLACTLYSRIKQYKTPTEDLSFEIQGSSLPLDWKNSFIMSLLNGGTDGLLKVLSVFRCED